MSVLTVVKSEDLNVSDDAVNIRQAALYCRSRMASDNHAATWLSIGQQLSKLKAGLKKITPRGDNEHIGWLQAFKQIQPNGKPEFPFTRQMAERYIEVSAFFSATAVALKLYPSLPSSLLALSAVAKMKMTREQIEAAIQAGNITPFSDGAQIARAAKLLGLKGRKAASSNRLPKKTAPKQLRVAAALKMLSKLGLTLEDLIKQTGESR